MLYKFKSKASGDVIMLAPNGDQVLRLVGREPAPRGIFEVEAMPQVAAALVAAVVADEAERQGSAAAETIETPGESRRDGVALRQRVWPLVEMLRRCHAAGEVIVWGA
jgi:hypothetical protein